MHEELRNSPINSEVYANLKNIELSLPSKLIIVRF